jgi:surface antigen
MNQQTLAQPRRKAKNKLKPSTIAIYASIFILLVVMIAIGYRPPQEVPGVANAATTVNNTVAETDQPTVSDVIATSLAANVAASANLPVASNVANLSISTQIKSELPQSDDSVISKPQIIQPSASSRVILSYAVAAGDTVGTVAARYGISTDTIKWANNLTSDNLTAGTSLQILPTTGVLYTVKSGDTVQSIAEKYQADASRIILYNDLESSGVGAGMHLILPNGTLPNTERPGYVAPITYYPTNYAIGSWGGDVKFLYRNTAPTSAGNKNTWGNCTWYAWERRAAIGRPLPSYALGNAAEWAYSLGHAGYTVVYGKPAVGAIMQNGGGLGHVAVVESIGENGDVTVTEMNYGGWYNGVSQRTISAGQASSYNYIY